MDNIKKRLIPSLKEQEGYRESVYSDTEGIPTIGSGVNLKDEENRGYLSMYGKDPAKLESGEDTIDEELNDRLLNNIVDRKLELSRNKLSPELWDTLNEDQQTVIGGLGYQSLNNIGPNLTNAIMNNDIPSSVYEIVANTNKSQSPGIQYRRLKQGQDFAGESFWDILSSFDRDTRNKILENLNKIENEHTRKEALENYSPYLKEQIFKKLFNK